jgi:hypothetical protein
VENKCIDQCQGENKNHIESPANPGCFVAVLCKQPLGLVRGISLGEGSALKFFPPYLYVYACTKQSLRENLHPLPRVVRAKEVCFPHRLIQMLDCSFLCKFPCFLISFLISFLCFLSSFLFLISLHGGLDTRPGTNDNAKNAKNQDHDRGLFFGEVQSSVFGSRVLRRLNA